MILSPEQPEIRSYCQRFGNVIKENELMHSGDDLCLSLWVLNERKNIVRSNFQSFVGFLPVKFTNFPTMYDSHEGKLIENTFFEEILDNEKNFLAEDFSLLKHERLLKHITKKEYYQAYTLFESRSYQFINNRKKLTSAFVPLVDLFNYKGGKESNHSKVAWKYDNKNNMFIVYAFEDIESGSKVS